MSGTLKAELLELSQQYWATYQRPTLLSALGSRLSSEARYERATSGKPLGTLIKEDFADALRWVPAVDHGGAVAPAKETMSLTDEQLDERIPPPVQKSINEPVVRNPVVYSELWKLFRDGIPVDQDPWVVIDDGEPTVRLLKNDETPDASWIQITQDDMPVTSTEGTRAEPRLIGEAVRAWAHKHEIALEKIQYFPSVDRVLNAGTKRPSLVRTEVSSLYQFMRGMSVLRHEELSRIMIPADIVVDMLRRHLR